MILNCRLINFLNTNEIYSWWKAFSTITCQAGDFWQLYIKSQSFYMYIYTYTHIHTHIYRYIRYIDTYTNIYIILIYWYILFYDILYWYIYIYTLLQTDTYMLLHYKNSKILNICFTEPAWKVIGNPLPHVSFKLA